MSMTNCEKDSLLGQTVLPPEWGQFFGGLVFFGHPLVSRAKGLTAKLIINFAHTLRYPLLLELQEDQSEGQSCSKPFLDPLID